MDDFLLRPMSGTAYSMLGPTHGLTCGERSRRQRGRGQGGGRARSMPDTSRNPRQRAAHRPGGALQSRPLAMTSSDLQWPAVGWGRGATAERYDNWFAMGRRRIERPQADEVTPTCHTTLQGTEQASPRGTSRDRRPTDCLVPYVLLNLHEYYCRSYVSGQTLKPCILRSGSIAERDVKQCLVPLQA